MANQNSPLLSIVIPMYNRRRLIGRLLHSCLNQRFCDYEIVVVDDKSTDDSAEVAYIDRPLYVGRGTRYSNGSLAEVRGFQGYVATLGGINIFGRSPSQIACMTNAIVHVFRTVRELVDDRLDRCDLELTAYAVAIHRDLAVKDRASAVGVAKCFEQWNEFVESLDDDRRIRVTSELGRLRQDRRPSIGRFKRFASKFGAQSSLVGLADVKEIALDFVRTAPSYRTALDAANETEGFLKAFAQVVPAREMEAAVG